MKSSGFCTRSSGIGSAEGKCQTDILYSCYCSISRLLTKVMHSSNAYTNHYRVLSKQILGVLYKYGNRVQYHLLKNTEQSLIWVKQSFAWNPKRINNAHEPPACRIIVRKYSKLRTIDAYASRLQYRPFPASNPNPKLHLLKSPSQTHGLLHTDHKALLLCSFRQDDSYWGIFSNFLDRCYLSFSARYSVERLFWLHALRETGQYLV